MTTDLADILADATIDLALAGIASPKNDAEILLAHVLKIDRNELRHRLVLDSLQIDDDAAAAYLALVTQRAAHTPLQHLTGVAHFRQLDLQVGPGVFIPRPETEVVAGAAIAEVNRLRAEPPQANNLAWQMQAPVGPPTARPRRLARWALQPAANPRPVVVDLGTGSGAIALAVATETTATVHAIENSDDAYQWATKNVAALPVGKTVWLRRGDALCPPADLLGKADVVVSNPPYIPPGAVPRDAEVREFDPPAALYGGGSDGLEIPAGIIASAASLLKPGGLLVMEHGDAQGAAVRELASITGLYREIETHPDLTDRDRYLTARRV